MIVSNKKRALYEDYANKARAFKQDESRLKDESMRQGYLKFLCPTPKDEVMFWAAYDALDMNDNKKQESSFKKVWNDMSYSFSLANIGVYAVNLVADLSALYYKALKEFLSLFKMQRANAEKQVAGKENGKKQENFAQSYELTTEKSKEKSKAFEKPSRVRNIEKVNKSEIDQQKEQVSSKMASRIQEEKMLEKYNESVRQRAMKKSEPVLAQEMGRSMSA